jgi:hypothetical protein
MQVEEALKTAQEAGRTGRIFYWSHALDQMAERNVRRHDVRHALANARDATNQDQPPMRWRISGPDLDDVALTVVVVFGGLLEVVTLF